MQLFSRPVPPDSPAFEELAEAVHKLAKSQNESHRAVAINLIHEHRVSEERARLFVEFLKTRPGVSRIDEANLIAGLAEYRRTVVAKKPTESFGEHPKSSLNYIDPASLPDLLHVCNVTRKLTQITKDSCNHKSVSDALGSMGLPTQEMKPDEVDIKLRYRMRDTSRRFIFVEQLLHLFDLYRKANAWNPIWAASWDHFNSTSIQGIPSSWLEAVGVPCDSGPSWLMLFRYSYPSKPSDPSNPRPSDPPNRREMLYRPTQLEAGIFPYHFPSPDCAKLKDGGHTMHLIENGPVEPLLVSEYVHEEIEFTSDHWFAAEALFERALVNSYQSLMSYRRRHHSLLGVAYGEKKVKKWMPNATTYQGTRG